MYVGGSRCQHVEMGFACEILELQTVLSGEDWVYTPIVPALVDGSRTEFCLMIAESEQEE